MKKGGILIILFIALIGIETGFSQTVNGKRISTIDVEYVEIVGRVKIFSQKLNIQIDFGQENRGFNSKDTEIRDRDGKAVPFNSMIDALNFMSKNGYDFVDSYSIVNSNDSTIYYLLKKRKTAEVKE